MAQPLSTGKHGKVQAFSSPVGGCQIKKHMWVLLVIVGSILHPERQSTSRCMDAWMALHAGYLDRPILPAHLHSSSRKLAPTNAGGGILGWMAIGVAGEAFCWAWLMQGTNLKNASSVGEVRSVLPVKSPQSLVMVASFTITAQYCPVPCNMTAAAHCFVYALSDLMSSKWNQSGPVALRFEHFFSLPLFREPAFG
jgi:hypothetical protein